MDDNQDAHQKYIIIYLELNISACFNTSFYKESLTSEIVSKVLQDLVGSCVIKTQGMISNTGAWIIFQDALSAL